MQDIKKRVRKSCLAVAATMLVCLCGCQKDAPSEVVATPNAESYMYKCLGDNLLSLNSVTVEKNEENTLNIYKFELPSDFFNEGHFSRLLEEAGSTAIRCYDEFERLDLKEVKYYEEDNYFYLVLVCNANKSITNVSFFEDSKSYHIENGEELSVNKCQYHTRSEGKMGQTSYIQSYNKEEKKWEEQQEFFFETELAQKD